MPLSSSPPPPGSYADLAERLVQWQMSIAEALREDVQSRRELHVKVGGGVCNRCFLVSDLSI